MKFLHAVAGMLWFALNITRVALWVYIGRAALMLFFGVMEKAELPQRDAQLLGLALVAGIAVDRAAVILIRSFVPRQLVDRT